MTTTILLLPMSINHSFDGIGSVAYVVYSEYEDHNGDAGIGDAGDD